MDTGADAPPPPEAGEDVVAEPAVQHEPAAAAAAARVDVDAGAERDSSAAEASSDTPEAGSAPPAPVETPASAVRADAAGAGPDADHASLGGLDTDALVALVVSLRSEREMLKQHRRQSMSLQSMYQEQVEEHQAELGKLQKHVISLQDDNAELESRCYRFSRQLSKMRRKQTQGAKQGAAGGRGRLPSHNAGEAPDRRLIELETRVQDLEYAVLYGDTVKDRKIDALHAEVSEALAHISALEDECGDLQKRNQHQQTQLEEILTSGPSMDVDSPGVGAAGAALGAAAHETPRGDSDLLMSDHATPGGPSLYVTPGGPDEHVTPGGPSDSLLYVTPGGPSDSSQHITPGGPDTLATPTAGGDGRPPALSTSPSASMVSHPPTAMTPMRAVKVETRSQISSVLTRVRELEDQLEAARDWVAAVGHWPPEAVLGQTKYEMDQKSDSDEDDEDDEDEDDSIPEGDEEQAEAGDAPTAAAGDEPAAPAVEPAAAGAAAE